MGGWGWLPAGAPHWLSLAGQRHHQVGGPLIPSLSGNTISQTPPPPTKSGKVRLEVEWEESAPGFPALSCERRLFPPPTHSLSLRAALETPILQESVQTERASELGLDGIRVAEMLLSHFWSLGIPGETRCLASESIIGA